MHAVDPVAGEILWTTDAVTPYAEVEIADGFGFYPFIASSDDAVDVADAGPARCWSSTLPPARSPSGSTSAGSPLVSP